MKKKKFALVTGLVSALGVLAFIGHKKQVKEQQKDSELLAEIRAFFAPMGEIEVVYLTEVNSRAGQAFGGVVFDDGVVFDFRYHKGDIDYKEHDMERNDEES